MTGGRKRDMFSLPQIRPLVEDENAKRAEERPYEYYGRDAIFICSADTLLKLAAGKLDPVFAFTTGKLKVEGSLEKALMLQKFV